MAVTQDAQGLAKAERAIVRERVVRRGHGKTASEQRLRTEFVGFEALTSYDQYGDAEVTQHAQRKITWVSPSMPWWCANGRIASPKRKARSI